jgi:signal transduction histidine kinase
MRNLISNAVKYTNLKGEIRISLTSNTNDILITVSDNGIGISKEDQLKLFDLSKQVIAKGTADEKGSGIGLVLCKEFVEKHNGKIWVESEPGKGSNFNISIPRSAT